MLKKTTKNKMKIVALPTVYTVRMKEWFIHENLVKILPWPVMLNVQGSK